MDSSSRDFAFRIPALLQLIGVTFDKCGSVNNTKHGGALFIKPDPFLRVSIKKSMFINCSAQSGGAVYLLAAPENQHMSKLRQSRQWGLTRSASQKCNVVFRNVKMAGNMAYMTNGVVHFDSISVCILHRYLVFFLCEFFSNYQLHPWQKTNINPMYTILTVVQRMENALNG